MLSISNLNKYRTLIYSLVVKDLKGRYSSSKLGSLWHFVMPLCMILLYYSVFGTLVYAEDNKYWIYITSSVFPFIFFQSNLAGGAMCIVANGDFIKKKYFPREILVISEVLSTLIVFFISILVIFIIFMLVGVELNASALIYLPFVMLLSVFFAFGYVLFLSALTVYLRDIQHIIDTFTRVLFWITPMFYHISDVTGFLSTIVYLNPLTYFIELYHEIFYYSSVPDFLYVWRSICISLSTMLIGLFTFNKLKSKFAEKL